MEFHATNRRDLFPLINLFFGFDHVFLFYIFRHILNHVRGIYVSLSINTEKLYNSIFKKPKYVIKKNICREILWKESWYLLISLCIRTQIQEILYIYTHIYEYIQPCILYICVLNQMKLSQLVVDLVSTKVW